MNLRATLFNVYWTLRRIIAPTLRYSQYEYEDTLRRCANPDSEWIEIGCGHSVLPSWRAKEEQRLVKNCKSVSGIDYDLYSLRIHPTISRKIRGDITKLPFKNESFNLATANMVVEHLDNPQEQFREIHRILQPKGVFVFHTPNARGYGVIMVKLVPQWLIKKIVYLLEGRAEEDIFKTYYRANTEQRIIALARETGFEIVSIQLLTTDAIFAMFPPLAILELLWLRILMMKPCRSFRTNIISVLRKVSYCSPLAAPESARAREDRRNTGRGGTHQLQQHFDVAGPDQVWVTDITYIRGHRKLLPWSLPSVAQYSYLLGFVLLFMSIIKAESVLASVGQSTMGVYLFHAPIILKGTSLVMSKVLDFVILYRAGAQYIALSLLMTKLLTCSSYG